MLLVNSAGKNAYSAGKTSGVLRGGALGAYRCLWSPTVGAGGKNTCPPICGQITLGWNQMRTQSL